MKTKKNILIILSDQQRYDTLGCNGNATVMTPNIDALASQSVVFDNCNTPYPLCCPARSSLWTGLLPHRHHVVENWRLIKPELRDRSLIDSFQKAGYHTFYTGKWHVPGTNPARWGFNDYSAIPAVLKGRDRGRYILEYREFVKSLGYNLVPDHIENLTHGDVENLNRPGKAPCASAEIKREHYLETWQTGQLLKALDLCPEDRPFLGICSYSAPHFPMVVPAPYDRLISPDSVGLSPNFCTGETNKPEEAINSKYHWGTKYFDEYEWRRLIAHYWGFCSLLDEQVGKIVEYLKSNSRFDDTIIVYTSDHGDMLGSHGLNQKNYTMHYEEVLRVPLIISDPDHRSSRRVNGLVSLMDVMPTLGELVGLEVGDDSIDGTSVASLMTHPDHKGIHDYLVAESFRFVERVMGGGEEGGNGDYIDPEGFDPEKNSINLSVKTETEKYIFHYRDQDELYDLCADPYENINRMATERTKPDIRGYQNLIIDSLRSTSPALSDIVNKKIEEPDKR